MIGWIDGRDDEARQIGDVRAKKRVCSQKADLAVEFLTQDVQREGFDRAKVDNEASPTGAGSRCMRASPVEPPPLSTRAISRRKKAIRSELPPGDIGQTSRVPDLFYL